MATQEPNSSRDSEDRNKEVTRVEDTVKMGRAETIPAPETKNSAMRAESLLREMKLVDLKHFLELQTGKISQISGEVAKATYELTGKGSYHEQHEKGLNYFMGPIQNELKAGRLDRALHALLKNYNIIIELNTERLLEEENYLGASIFLSQFEDTVQKGRPIDQKIEDDIDELLLGSFKRTVDTSEAYLGDTYYRVKNDRIWSLVHNGYYEEAVKVCREVSAKYERAVHKKVVGKFPERRDTHVDLFPPVQEEDEQKTNILPLKPLANPADIGAEEEEPVTLKRPQIAAQEEENEPVTEVMETDQERRERDERELFEGLPKSIDAMRKVFPYLADIMRKYEEEANVYPEDIRLRKAYKGLAQEKVSALFNKHMLELRALPEAAAEELIQTISNLEALGFHLYVGKNRYDKALHLLTEEEANNDFFPVQISKLSANDFVIDEKNFHIEEVTKVSPASDEETVVTPPPKIVWLNRELTLSDEGIKKFKRAA